MKRKKLTDTSPDAPQSKLKPFNTKGHSICYDDLPEATKRGIERQIEFRKRLNLSDDSDDRKQRALRYYLDGHR